LFVLAYPISHESVIVALFAISALPTTSTSFLVGVGAAAFKEASKAPVKRI
jgi:hypothetical protein